MSASIADSSPNEAKWPSTCAFTALGHTLDSSGSIQSCWRRTKASMWKAYRGNLGSASAKEIPMNSRMRLLDRAVTPVLDYRCSRWPVQRQMVREVDSLQRKMVAGAMRIGRQSGETTEDYYRRRGRVAASHCRRHGQWSARWCNRVLAWNEHLKRERNAQAWPAITLAHHGYQWLLERRASYSSTSATAGKTCTRLFPGCPHTRWHDGVELARTLTM